MGAIFEMCDKMKVALKQCRFEAIPLKLVLNNFINNEHSNSVL